MTIWGKLAGAAAGLAVGGPIGALVGGLAGHLFIDHEDPEKSCAAKQMAFTIGVIALGAKMAKADGHVTSDEVHAFKEVFIIPDGEAGNVARIFNMARQDVAGFEAYARQLADLFAEDRETLRDVLDGLFHIAKADGVLHPGEDSYLAEVAQIFGFSDAEYQCIRARHVMEEGPDPYQVLGVRPTISNDDLKTHYRKLVKEHHPDRLAGAATRKIAAINEAYDQVRQARGI